MATMFDLAIIGSGFAGSLLAMIARRLGRNVILLERGRHPRFAIGESSTPLTNLLLRQLAQRYDLPRLLPLTRFGEWQRAYPRIGCGLKRGFSFFQHLEGQPFRADPAHHNQLLVAANIDTFQADTHWYRSDFDHFLVQEAQALGAESIEDLTLEEMSSEPSGVGLRGRRGGETIHIKARFVVDASGPRGFLHQRLGLGEISRPLETTALFTHFRDVRRLETMSEFAAGSPPFPIDDAAVHHVLPGGWIWVLRFNNGITSAGVAARSDWATRFRFEEGAEGWSRLLQLFPSIAEQFRPATPVQPFRHLTRLGFRSARAAGPNWAFLPRRVLSIRSYRLDFP
jgi:FADH2 O2-dependent halogenase